MPAKLFLDYEFLTSQPVIHGMDKIRSINPQRYEMEHLSAIVYYNEEEGLVAGYKDVKDDEFWVRGHLPERPLLPGVIMLEAGAQMSSIYYHMVLKDMPFFGFAGLDDVRFRGTVTPGDRLYLIAKKLKIQRNRGYFAVQGIVDGKLVFQAKVLGMVV